MAVPGWLSGLAANSAQWGANVNQALGDSYGANNLRNLSNNIRDKNVVYSGGLGGIGDGRNNWQTVAYKPQNEGAPANQAPQTPSNPSGAYTGGSTGPSAADISYYNDQMASLQRLLGNTDTGYSQGASSLLNSKNKALDRLNYGQSQTLSNYATQRTRAGQANQRNLSQIDNNTRDQYNNIMRMLQAGGSGVSSTADVLVPTLLSQQGTQQRANTKETYDANLADLKYAEDDAKQQYEFARGDVDEQYNSGVRDLSQRTQNTKMSILDQLRALESERAGGYVAANRSQFAGAQSAAQAALDQLLNYRAPEVAARDVQVRTPEMREYGVDQAELEAANPEMDQSVLDYLPQLLRRQREQAGYL